MATPASGAILAAARDNDLLARMVALGAATGKTQAEVEAARMRLASSACDAAGETIANVYAYAATLPRYRAGEDPSGVTDAHILFALDTLPDTPA